MITLLNLIKKRINQVPVNPTVLKIEKFLYENYNKPITLEDIEKFTFFSKTHCHVIFKNEKGVSIIDFLNNYSINKAKELLIEGAMPLNDISEMIGFSSYNYFSRLFKKKTGYSPKEYRRIIK